MGHRAGLLVLVLLLLRACGRMERSGMTHEVVPAHAWIHTPSEQDGCGREEARCVRRGLSARELDVLGADAGAPSDASAPAGKSVFKI
jgi:hypothetical protein